MLRRRAGSASSLVAAGLRDFALRSGDGILRSASNWIVLLLPGEKFLQRRFWVSFTDLSIVE